MDAGELGVVVTVESKCGPSNGGEEAARFIVDGPRPGSRRRIRTA